MEAAMSDHAASFLARTVCAGLAAGLLVAAFPAGGDDLFPEDAARGVRSGVLQCPAGAPAGPDLQSRIAQIQRQIAAQSGGAPESEGTILLNGSGYNYGGPTREIDQGALDFEAKQAR
jgi:hypothetical protein